jgi:hypothetical protein
MKLKVGKNEDDWIELYGEGINSVYAISEDELVLNALTKCYLYDKKTRVLKELLDVSGFYLEEPHRYG